MTRILITDVVARMDERDAKLDERLAALTETLDNIAKGVQGQFVTPGAVVEISSAPSRRTRKGAKAKAKVSVAKVAPTLVSMDEAKALVDAGESPWKVFVASTNPERLGSPVPYFRAARAEAVKAGEVKGRESSRDENKATAEFLRGHELPCNGPVWAEAKKGVRNVSKLRGIAKKAAQA